MSEEPLRWCWPMVPFDQVGRATMWPNAKAISRMCRAFSPSPFDNLDFSRSKQESDDIRFDRTPMLGENLKLHLPGDTKQGIEIPVFVPENIGRAKVFRFYVPTDGDLALGSELFPDSEPGNLPWLKVEANLNLSGVPTNDFRQDTAFMLLERLKASRMPPEPELTAYTFGRLLEDLENHDATRRLANRTGAKSDGSLLVGSASVNYILQAAMYHSNANETWQSFIDRPGVKRLKAICEAERWKFDAETLRMMRGQLCNRFRLEPDNVDSIELPTFVDLWLSDNADGAIGSENVGKSDGKQFNANEQMMVQFTRDRSCIDWPATKWVEWFKTNGREVDDSTIKKTATWKVIMAEREREKLSRHGGESDR